MTDPKLLAQARQGDAIAILALLNTSLQPQGIWARLEPQSPGLAIVLESTQAPPPDQLEQRIRTGLQRLQPQGITEVTLWGWALGDIAPTWERHFRLTVAGPERAVVTPAVPPGPLQSVSTTSTSPQSASLSRIKTHSRSATQRTIPPRQSPHPFVLKWSDFEPMMLVIVGFVAIYGFLGSRNPGYDGPFIWLHYPDLAIHETGHLLFMPFGHFLMVLGGSLTQIAFPAVFTGYFFYSQQFFSSALTLFWTGQNFMDVAVYMRDAPVRQLPLTVDNIDAHDWWQLFNMMNCMEHAHLIANITHGIGVLLYVASVMAGIYCAYHTQQAIGKRRFQE